jgi:hypothetical protein
MPTHPALEILNVQVGPLNSEALPFFTLKMGASDAPLVSERNLRGGDVLSAPGTGRYVCPSRQEA